jgi:predicted alpha/beta-fold hydrolase
LECQDGGEIVLDWILKDSSGKEYSEEVPTLVILAGLVGTFFPSKITFFLGSSKSSYMKNFLSYFSKTCNWRVVVMNARGTGDTILKVS